MAPQSTGEIQDVDTGGPDGIDVDREEIDLLDSQIIDIIQRRRRISHRIQQRRLGSGGPRTVLSREMVVLDRYREALGAEGNTLAIDILHFCRGAAPAPKATVGSSAATADDAGPSA
ncbi:chorismate mutase [Kitasatospora herbaricolor]|uniref:Chorismate mutase n=1 Tax=Kitasatospora herbaricolor TaxID=68217 RepID=A0ABZ1W3N6_9ACTN|nr:chorismate mutase [Kitasatospora herbaricolor]